MLGRCVLIGLFATATFSVDPGTAEPLAYQRTLVQVSEQGRIFDNAVEIWKWTFGMEPGAKLIAQDRATGTISGAARLNFRSTELAMRERTMGSINYKVTIQADQGACKVLITDIVHTGNSGARGGAIDFGMLTLANGPEKPVAGVGRKNAIRIWDDMKAQVDARLAIVLDSFENRMRSADAP